MNILIVRTDKLGDFITALPACKVLKNYNLKNKIYICVAPLNESLAKECDFIDEVIVDDGCSVFKLAKKFKNAKIDVSITLFSNTRVAFAQFLAHIKKRIAPATKIAQIFYTKRVRQKRSKVKMAEFEYNLELTKVLFSDINLSFKKPLLAFKNTQDIYTKFCKKYHITQDIIAFHPGFGGSSDANWNIDQYIELAKTALHAKNKQILLTFGPDEQELYDYCNTKLNGTDIILYISQDGLVNFAKLLSNFKLFISTSTGVYHLCALVGTPTMTFFGNSLFASAKRWKSISDESIQNHYMISDDSQQRDQMFKEIKQKLLLL